MRCQVMLHGTVRRGGGDRAGQPELVKRIEQFDRARLQREASLRQNPEMLCPGRQKFIDRKCRAEMIQQQAADVVMGKTMARTKMPEPAS